MRNFSFILLLIFLSLLLLSCSRKNVLSWSQKPYYRAESVREDSLLSEDSQAGLSQSVCYNAPGVVDEEFCYDLELHFIDTASAKTKKDLDLEKDTAIVRSSFGIFSGAKKKLSL
jgi:hypothetical protein